MSVSNVISDLFDLNRQIHRRVWWKGGQSLVSRTVKCNDKKMYARTLSVSVQTLTARAPMGQRFRHSVGAKTVRVPTTTICFHFVVCALHMHILYSFTFLSFSLFPFFCFCF